MNYAPIVEDLPEIRAWPGAVAAAAFPAAQATGTPVTEASSS